MTLVTVNSIISVSGETGNFHPTPIQNTLWKDKMSTPILLVCRTRQLVFRSNRDDMHKEICLRCSQICKSADMISYPICHDKPLHALNWDRLQTIPQLKRANRFLNCNRAMYSSSSLGCTSKPYGKGTSRVTRYSSVLLRCLFSTRSEIVKHVLQSSSRTKGIMTYKGSTAPS